MEYKVTTTMVPGLVEGRSYRLQILAIADESLTYRTGDGPVITISKMHGATRFSANDGGVAAPPG